MNRNLSWWDNFCVVAHTDQRVLQRKNMILLCTCIIVAILDHHDCDKLLVSWIFIEHKTIARSMKTTCNLLYCNFISRYKNMKNLLKNLKWIYGKHYCQGGWFYQRIDVSWVCGIGDLHWLILSKLRESIKSSITLWQSTTFKVVLSLDISEIFSCRVNAEPVCSNSGYPLYAKLLPE